jgi:hypothetical protein
MGNAIKTGGGGSGKLDKLYKIGDDIAYSDTNISSKKILYKINNGNYTKEEVFKHANDTDSNNFSIKLTDDKFLCLYSNGTIIYAVVVTLGTTLSTGTELNLGSSSSLNTHTSIPAAGVKINDSEVLIIIRSKFLILQITDTTITLKSQSSGRSDSETLMKINDNVYLIDSNCYIYPITISGTTITIGTAVQTITQYFIGYYSESTFGYIFYRDINDSYVYYAKIIESNGVVTIGTAIKTNYNGSSNTFHGYCQIGKNFEIKSVGGGLLNFTFTIISESNVICSGTNIAFSKCPQSAVINSVEFDWEFIILSVTYCINQTYMYCYRIKNTLMELKDGDMYISEKSGYINELTHK